jgi:hypothetical protein
VEALKKEAELDIGPLLVDDFIAIKLMLSSSFLLFGSTTCCRLTDKVGSDSENEE